MYKHLKYLLLFSTILFFSACGDSSFTAKSSASSMTSLSGNIAKGYIQETAVCLDLDYNNNCNVSEPVAQTDEDGLYSFSDLDIRESALIPVLALNSKKRLRTIVELSPDEDLQNIVISPLTDLKATYFLNSNEKSSLDLLDAQNLVISNFNISSYQLEQDPISSRTLFIATQKIFYTAMLVKSAIYKNKSSVDTLERQKQVEELIKEELLRNTTNVSTILFALETTLGIAIAPNEKVFIERQLEELRSEINTIAFASTIENLKDIQEYLSHEFLIINERLKVIEGDYRVEILDLNISL